MGDWQSETMTSLERNRHMFNNPHMSDVKFTCEGSEKEFYAHKHVLCTSSHVFDVMFNGTLPEKNPVVHLNDTDEETFGLFLRYLYTDDCEVTTDNVVSVLYLAKKYFVTALVLKCFKLLEDNIAVDNVFVVLQQAILFDEKNSKLEGKCWKLIDMETSMAVASEAFVDISQATLEQLLRRNTLRIKEAELFKYVLKWSEEECLRKNIEANASNKRHVLGNAIYQVRCHSMTAPQFANIVSRSGLLTPEEKVFFYENSLGLQGVSEVWNMSEREAIILLRCSRFTCYRSVANPSKVSPITLNHAIDVSFSKPVKIHGVRLFDQVGHKHDVTLSIRSQTIKKKCVSETDDARGRARGFDVLFPKPIRVLADMIVRLRASVNDRGDSPGWFGCNGIDAVEMKQGATTVRFFNAPDQDKNRTSVEEGQFDEIIFSEF